MAFFNRVPISASSAAVNLTSPKALSHMLPWSRFAASWKPNVEYLALNFYPLWKKQMTLPSLPAYAGIPYQVLGVSSGTLALISACSRLAVEQSVLSISAILASTADSPTTFFHTLNSLLRSFMAASSSSENVPRVSILVPGIPALLYEHKY